VYNAAAAFLTGDEEIGWSEKVAQNGRINKLRSPINSRTSNMYL
jgi:hypothetical protein